jgi:WNK lysine deficient protein kinase
MKKVKVIRWKVVKRWVRDILKGLVYLHSLEPVVIHRDLKCDNVFINGQKGDLRIGDLGLSRRKDMAEKGKTALTLAGTPAFMAPEFYTEQ